jgi:hypothetical protein
MMDGFKVTILNPGNAVCIYPGTIHAVVSPTNSAIGRAAEMRALNHLYLEIGSMALRVARLAANPPTLAGSSDFARIPHQLAVQSYFDG